MLAGGEGGEMREVWHYNEKGFDKFCLWLRNFQHTEHSCHIKIGDPMIGDIKCKRKTPIKVTVEIREWKLTPSLTRYDAKATTEYFILDNDWVIWNRGFCTIQIV